jgi:hypothetical protein
MVVIVGNEWDSCCRLVQQSLDRENVPNLFLREAAAVDGLNMSVSLSDESLAATLHWDGSKIDLGQTSAVLSRSWGVSTKDVVSEDRSYVFSEWAALFRGWFEIFEGPIVNRLRPELWNHRRLGAPSIHAFAPILAPATTRFVVSNDAHELRRFFDDCRGRVVLSPLTAMSNYVLERREDFEKAVAISNLMPLYMRDDVAGDSVEVIVVGGESFMAETGIPIDDDLRQRCIAAAHQLGVYFCSFELDEGSDGGLRCSMIDLSPNVSAYPEPLQIAIVSRLAAYLSGDSATGTQT